MESSSYGYIALGVFALLAMAFKTGVPADGDALTNVSTGGSRRLTKDECYGLAREAGFPPEVARQMVAIAMRESGLDPSARCTNCVPGVVEDSIGLWQINMYGALGASRMEQFGLSSPDELLDPSVNARAAYLTWGGSSRNLEIAWKINSDAGLPYRTRYLANLATLPNLDAMELAYNNLGAVNA